MSSVSSSMSRRDFLKSSTLVALAPAVQGFLARTARAALPPALRSSRSVSSSLVQLDDLVLSTDIDPRKVVPAPGPGNDLRAFVNRSLLDAYTASDRLREMARPGEAGTAYPATALA